MAVQEASADGAPPTVASIEQSRKPGAMGRMETALKSFRVLRDLTPEQVDNFMNSYIIYDLDWADEKMMVDKLGPDYQKKVGDCLRDYYSVLNHMCAIGELEKMYIPPVMQSRANVTRNQILYEESIAQELELPANARVLDLGCGRGRVAAHMSQISGARVTGINIDHDQINSAIAYNKENGYENEFIRGDFNDLPLPLPDNEFDGFYQIQAFSLCKDIPKLCRELYRVLKPGARLSLLDWASLEDYDPEDAHHRELMRRIKPLIGAVGTPTPDSLTEDLESAGFEVLRTNNASIDGLQAPLIERADIFYRCARYGLLGLVNMGLLPEHFRTLFNRFTQDGAAFMEADRKRLITTSYHWLAVKPKTELNGGLATATANGDNVAVSSSSTASSSDSETKPPSPANSDSTGITIPPAAPEVSVKA